MELLTKVNSGRLAAYRCEGLGRRVKKTWNYSGPYEPQSGSMIYVHGTGAEILSGLADGDYQVEWYDTSSSLILRRDTVSVDHLTHFSYGIELKPPEFWGDIAARVIREDRRWYGVEGQAHSSTPAIDTGSLLPRSAKQGRNVEDVDSRPSRASRPGPVTNADN